MAHITLKEKDALYLASYMMRSMEPNSACIPWQTTICPECGEIPQLNDSLVHILDEDGFILIACEGYWVINPISIGIELNGWHDWHEEIGGLDNDKS